MRTLSGLVLCAIGLLAPQARADITFVGSQAGLNAFNVTLHQVNTGDVLVTVTLTQGAQWFSSTGNGTNHPGFAFNLNGNPAVTITNVSLPWDITEFHTTPAAVTSGPDLGTFNYYFDNPGNGTSLNNTGPLSFDVNRPGISINDFTKNAAGYYFAADIATSRGNTGESGISAAATPVPEPSSIGLLLLSLAGAGWIGKKRLKAS